MDIFNIMSHAKFPPKLTKMPYDTLSTGSDQLHSCTKYIQIRKIQIDFQDIFIYPENLKTFETKFLYFFGVRGLEEDQC